MDRNLKTLAPTPDTRSTLRLPSIVEAAGGKASVMRVQGSRIGTYIIGAADGYSIDPIFSYRLKALGLGI